MVSFRPSRIFRRLSSRETPNIESNPSPTDSATASPDRRACSVPASQRVRKSSSLPKLRKKFTSQAAAEVPEAVQEQRESVFFEPERERNSGEQERLSTRSGSATLAGGRRGGSAVNVDDKTPRVRETELKLDRLESLRRQPILTLQEATPDANEVLKEVQPEHDIHSQETTPGEATLAGSTPGTDYQEDLSRDGLPDLSHVSTRSISPGTLDPPTSHRPTETIARRPSIVDSANAKIVKTLVNIPSRDLGLPTSDTSIFLPHPALLSPDIHDMTAMLHRKIWVKRPGASATLVQIREDDVVDDVRDMILRKYANSLGRTFDAPDMTLSIATRSDHGSPRQERMLGPEEAMCRTLDSYYPGGQSVEEALIINVPQRRTPRPSPRVMQQSNYSAMDEYRPLENGGDYFPLMPAVIPPTVPQTTNSHDSRASHHHHPSIVAAHAEHPRSISVLNTGQVPPLPSPGAQSRRHQHRPKFGRQATTSPTMLAQNSTAGGVTLNPQLNGAPSHMVHRQSTRPRMDSIGSEASHHAPNGINVSGPPPLPTPPAPEATAISKNTSAPPTPAAGAILPGGQYAKRPKKNRKNTPEKGPSRLRQTNADSIATPSLVSSMLDASVPPINVLIVEDNIINLRILEGLMKRLKVRWQTAMNGQIAVDKWKEGGFHLVLMDIQMPVMSGLQATKEIRRLESVNGIGVFSSNSNVTSPVEGESVEKGNDRLSTIKEGGFKSPIIIVALTASSLQSDRHEALAAGCNDFLTKPVNFVWLERKVKEWGCMQALIDFDGWRKWKDFAAKQEEGKSEEERTKDAEKEQKDKIKMEKFAKLQEKQAKMKEEKDRKAKRASLTGPAIVEGIGMPSALRPAAEVLGAAGFE